MDYKHIHKDTLEHLVWLANYVREKGFQTYAYPWLADDERLFQDAIKTLGFNPENFVTDALTEELQEIKHPGFAVEAGIEDCPICGLNPKKLNEKIDLIITKLGKQNDPQ